MTILCKTKLLFVAATLIMKNLLFTFLILISPYVWTLGIFNKIPFLILYNFKSHDEIRINENINYKI